MMLLTLGGFITAAALFATVFPSIAKTSNSITADRSGVAAQSTEHVTVVNAYSELDLAGAWDDIDADVDFDIWIWVKNDGDKTIKDLDQLDVFLHSSGTSERVPHEDDAGVAYPRYAYTVEESTDWQAGKTLKITVHYDDDSAVSSGAYDVEVATAAGAASIERFDF